MVNRIMRVHEALQVIGIVGLCAHPAIHHTPRRVTSRMAGAGIKGTISVVTGLDPVPPSLILANHTEIR